MNREIKFRAWQDKKIIISPISSNYELTRFFGFLYEDTPIMQFTGLKDKNSIDIYEGDLILWIDEFDDIIQSEVKFSKNDTIGWSFGNLQKIGSEKLWVNLIPDEMEIIGNIYETQK